jgi:hypothetical protein
VAQQHLLYVSNKLVDHCLLWVDHCIGKDLMLFLVLRFHGGGGGKDRTSSFKAHSFKDVVNNKPSSIVPTHLPNMYIVKKSEEILVLEVTEERVCNLLSYSNSKEIICLFKKFRPPTSYLY